MKGHGQLWDTAEGAMTRSGDWSERGRVKWASRRGWHRFIIKWVTNQSYCLHGHEEHGNIGAVWRKCQAPVWAWPVRTAWETYTPILCRQLYTWTRTLRGSLAVGCTGAWAWEGMWAPGKNVEWGERSASCSTRRTVSTGKTKKGRVCKGDWLARSSQMCKKKFLKKK